MLFVVPLFPEFWDLDICHQACRIPSPWSFAFDMVAQERRETIALCQVVHLHMNGQLVSILFQTYSYLHHEISSVFILPKLAIVNG